VRDMDEQLLRIRCRVRQILATFLAALVLVLGAAPSFPDSLLTIESDENVVADVLASDADPDTDSDALAPTSAAYTFHSVQATPANIAASPALTRSALRPLPRGPPEIR